MNIYPILAPISVGIGVLAGYFLMKYIAKKMGKPFPGIGELMFPMPYPHVVNKNGETKL